VSTDPDLRSALEDLREVPLGELVHADLGAALGRVLPDPEAVVVPVAAFSSAI
jgi:FXSXX-COOH protein